MSEAEIRCDYCGRACTGAEQASGWCDHCKPRPIEAGSRWAEMLARDWIRFEEQPMNIVTKGPLAPLPPMDDPAAFVTRELWDDIRARIAELEAASVTQTERAFKAGFMAATKYTTGHLSDEQVALVQDAEWDSYAGRTSE